MDTAIILKVQEFFTGKFTAEAAVLDVSLIRAVSYLAFTAAGMNIELTGAAALTGIACRILTSLYCLFQQMGARRCTGTIMITGATVQAAGGKRFYLII